MQNHTSHFFTTGLAATVMLAAPALSAAEATAEKDDNLKAVENYVTVSAQGNWVSKDKEAYEAQNWTSRKGFFGIEDFDLTKDLKGDIGLKADGHILAGNADYLAHINVSKNEIGSVDAGFSRFRTYYDGIGGFFPNNNAWFPSPNKQLHIDRQKTWVGVTLALPDAPVMSIRYTNELRDGAKDSTIWGDTDYTGVPNWTTAPTNPVSSNRKLLPAVNQIGERKDSLVGSIKYTFGKTTVEGSVTGTRIRNLNTRSVNRYYYPGYSELRPYPAVTGTTAASPTPPNLISTPNHGFDQTGVKSDSLAFASRVENRLTDKITLFAGINYCNTTSDLLGKRLIYSDLQTNVGVVSQVGGAAYSGSLATPPAFSSVRPPYSYTDFSGGGKAEELTANIGADIKLMNNLFIEAALKHESEASHTSDSFTFVHNLVNQNTGVVTNYNAVFPEDAKVKEHAWVPELSARYTGIKTISLYTTIDYRNAPGYERTMYFSSGTLSGQVGLQNNYSNTKENHLRYTVGANWVPCSYFTARAEAFAKDNRNNFYGAGDNGGLHLNTYDLGTTNNGGKLTITVKPVATLSSTTRYIYQKGKVNVAAVGNPVSTLGTPTYYSQYQSADSTSHNIGETIDWTPVKQFYVQGSFNMVFDTTSTAYPRAGLTANDVLRNADNNYSNASLIAGLVVDKYTNLEFQVTEYRADNYDPLYSSIAYGASAKDSTYTVKAKRRLSESLVVEAKVGYLKSKNDTTGGFTNYDAYVGYVSLQQAF